MTTCYRTSAVAKFCEGRPGTPAPPPASCGTAGPKTIRYTEVSNMAISKDLLEILVCPLCKATVEMKPDQSGLKCVQCHRVYPIRDEIPVMLVDEAKIEE